MLDVSVEWNVEVELGEFLGLSEDFFLPLVKKHVLPHAASAAKGLAQDVMAGRNIKQALKQHSLSAAKGFGEGLLSAGNSEISSQLGSGVGKKRKQAPKKKKKKIKRIKSLFD